MTTFYRAVTQEGETIVIDSSRLGSDLMWVDPDPLDLSPAQYTDTTLVQLGDHVCAGGDEFRVEAIEPAHGKYLFGRARSDRGVWYGCEFLVCIKRRGVT